LVVRYERYPLRYLTLASRTAKAYAGGVQMDVDFSAEQRDFRDEVRTWLTEHAPKDVRPEGGVAIREYDLGWQRTQYEAGWAGISWPTEYGGRGGSLIEQLIWYEEYGRAGLPSVDACFVGLNHAGPTLMLRA